MGDAGRTRPEDGSEPDGADRAAAGGQDGPADGPAEGTADAATDGIPGAETDASGRDPRRFNEWRKRSATGAVMTGIALGLKEALELPRQRPALVIEAPGEPDDPDRPIDLHFDPDDPARTVAIVRHREDKMARNREDSEDDEAGEAGAVDGPDRRP